MINNDTIIEVTNKTVGRVGYKVPDLNIKRIFNYKETKEVPFEELKKLSYTTGGMYIIKECLTVKNKEALKMLSIDVEPEYFYSEADIKRVMTTGSLDEFLDCLDFAPEGVIETIKDLSVSLPLNDVAKREAVLEKLGFNIEKAIEIKKVQEQDNVKEDNKPARRVASADTAPATPTGRRTSLPTYNVVNTIN